MLNSPALVKDFCRLQLGHLSYEFFSVLYLNLHFKLIQFSKLFRGTLAETHVYPREIARESLLLNAAGVILVHNHPSGCCEPSALDKEMTNRIRTYLNDLNIKVFDHVIVTLTETFSFNEQGLVALDN